MGSAPTSPAVQRKMAMSMISEINSSNLAASQLMSSSLTSFDRQAVDEEYDEQHEPTSLPFVRKFSFRRRRRSRLSQQEKAGSNEGPIRQMCMDCKEMVFQVVRAQSTARRIQLAKSLFQQQTTKV